MKTLTCLTCPTCGTSENNEHTVNSWIDLHGYHFVIYPNDLFIVTNASRSEFDEAVEVVRQSHDEGNIQNIDDVLQDRGFIAMVGENSNPTIHF